MQNGQICAVYLINAYDFIGVASQSGIAIKNRNGFHCICVKANNKIGNFQIIKTSGVFDELS